MMNLKLLLKQSIKDFTSKMQLYLSFTIFLAVCISLIIGMFSFTASFEKNYNNVYGNGYNRNAKLYEFRFVDENADTEPNRDKFNLEEHYLVANEKFAKYIYDLAENEDNFGRKLTPEEMEILKKLDTLESYDTNNLINVIGENFGYVDTNLMNNFIFNFRINEKEIIKENEDGSVEILKSKDDLDIRKTQYIALKKIQYILKNGSTNEKYKGYFYKQNILHKYFIEEKISNYNNEIFFGSQPSWNGPRRKVIDKNAQIAPTYMPTESWMEKYKDSNIPNATKQFYKNPMQELYIDSRLPIDKIDPVALKNMNYLYLEPSFFHGNHYKLGDYISWFNGETITQPMQIIGTAITKPGFYNKTNFGFAFVPPQKMKEASGNANFNGPDNLDVYFKKAGNDLTKAYELLKSQVMDDLNPDHIMGVPNMVSGSPLSGFEVYYKMPQTNLFLYKILSFAIAGGSLLLLFTVFWFIINESIKMQKQTLWFLKSIGERNIILSILTTLSTMIPFILAALFSIFGSIGIGAIMNSAVRYSYSFYIPIWNFGFTSLFALLIISGISIIMFFVMNYIKMTNGSLTLNGRNKVGIFTKSYMKVKPILKLNSSTTIGLSFMVQNLFKNLLTFILLLFSFSIVLFAMQFNSSSKYSAGSYERRNAPYQSIFMNKMNVNDSLTVNKKFLMDNFDLKEEQIENFLKIFEFDSVQKILYSKGYQTSLVNNYDSGYRSIESQLQLTSIDNTNEFSKTIRKTLIPIKDDYSSNMYNYYLSEDYMKNELLNNNIDSKDIANKILNLNYDEMKLYINTKLDDILESLKVANEDAEKIKNEINNKLSEKFVDKLIDYITNEFKEIIDSLRSLSENIKSEIMEFNKNINIYFNRSIIPKDSESYYSTNLLYDGTQVTGVGLDSRDNKTYHRIMSPYKEIKEIENNEFKTGMYNFKKKNDETVYKKNIHYIDVNISGNFADNHRINKNDIIKVSAPAWVMSNGQIQDIYLKVNNIVKGASSFKEVYFNKHDLISYLRESFLHNWSDNAPIIVSPYENIDEINKETVDYKNLTNILNRIEGKNGEYELNNAVFSKEIIPYSLRYLTLNSKMIEGKSFLDYIPLPFFRYESEMYKNNYNNDVYIFSYITKAMMDVIKPISVTINRFIILLLILTAVVAIILINLILLENKNIILLFKSMGYRKWQVNGYLTFGYMLSTIFALIVGVIISYFGISIVSKLTISMIGVSLFFVWSWQFILTALLMAFVFAGVTLVSVSTYTKYLKPKDAFNSL